MMTCTCVPMQILTWIALTILCTIRACCSLLHCIVFIRVSVGRLTIGRTAVRSPFETKTFYDVLDGCSRITL